MKIISEEKQFFTAAAIAMLLFIGEIVGFVFAAIRDGYRLFFSYSEISNILVLLSVFFSLETFFANIRKGCGTNPYAHILRYAAACASSLVLFVAPFLYADGTINFFTGRAVLHDMICPLLSSISFLFFEKQESRNLKYAHIAVGAALPIVYGALFLALNAFRVHSGPYPFFLLYEKPASFVASSLVTLLIGEIVICFLLCVGNKKIFFRGIIRG